MAKADSRSVQVRICDDAVAILSEAAKTFVPKLTMAQACEMVIKLGQDEVFGPPDVDFERWHEGRGTTSPWTRRIATWAADALKQLAEDSGKSQSDFLEWLLFAYARTKLPAMLPISFRRG